jgi:ribosome-associated protein
LGEHLITLKEAHLIELNLPESLFDALMEAKRLKSHEALRRQRQLIGKLMKHADVPAIEQLLQARNFGK